MKNADIALYRAKAQGRNCVLTYSPVMRREIEERVSLGSQVREALARDQMVPFYQPKVSLSTGKIIGFEALARLKHPSQGILSPAFFGAAFEDPELATGIRKQIIGKITADMRSWLDSNIDFGRVAMNLSSADFNQPALVEDILDALAIARIPPERFELEITETVLLGRSSDCVSAILNRLRGQGIRIALDDFGTGYASLMHLKQFPVDHVKIDRTFIKDLSHGSDDEAIVAAVIGLGKSLRLDVTAEGVETQEQVTRLRQLGCDYAQGFYYAASVPGERVLDLLRGGLPRDMLEL
jgi:EAL domain-containing protein (putative c-di-GMP-specific phosphodiesterase class I)